MAEICHTPALFSENRISDREIPESLFRYELRGGEDGKPNAVSGRVEEHFAGTIITGKPLSIPESGILELDVTDGPLLSSSRSTIRAFQQEQSKSRNTEEVEAESVSYAVCQYYGIETGENSFGYIATWSKGKDLKELRASLETITKTANHLINSIDKHFQAICKERGIDLSEQKAEEATAAEAEKESVSSEQPAPETTETESVSETEPTAEVAPTTENTPVTEAEPTPQTVEATPQMEAEAMEAEPAPEDSSALEVDDTDQTAAQPEAQTTPQEEQAHSPENTLEAVQGANVAETPEQTESAAEAPEEEAKAETPPVSEAEAVAEQADTVLDEYPMPDPDTPMEALTGIGYKDNDLLPLSRERACELFEQDMTVYTLQANAEPEMAFDTDELREQPEGTLFAISREEWEVSPIFQEAVSARLERQPEREAAFLNHAEDCFAIYQVRMDDEFRNLRYEALDRLQANGLSPERGNYDLAYTAALPQGTGPETIFKWFNTFSPPDYRRPSVSMSDILAIKKDGVVTCHYVDRIGFTEISGFLARENPVKDAETQTEHDQRTISEAVNHCLSETAPATETVPAAETTPMPAVETTPADTGSVFYMPLIPGVEAGAAMAALEEKVRSGQAISLLELAEASQYLINKPYRKQSVIAQLHQKLPEQDRQHKAPKKSAERGL